MLKKIALPILVLVIAGCAGQVQKPARICPGKKNVDEAIAALNEHRQKQIPVKAAGQCLLKYQYQGKQHQENFPVKLWINPPDEIYLQGDVAFDATGLVFGANSQEFWLWLKPKEASTYWWGRWSQTNNWAGFALSPKALMEAFGFINTTQGDWSLTHGQYDILWLHNEDGVLLKRIYIETCDYVPAKIEYFDPSGKVIGGAEFIKYKRFADEDYIPMQIRIYTGAGEGNGDSALITLTSAEPTRLNEQQRERLFNRPAPKGFNHIYQIIDGNAVEQGHE
ncbi:MAG: hypothetical protein ABSH16_12635 [Sedimentisphaerales bacterium]